nr:tetratricopeptide repeat protein [Aminobacter aminovorans]
MKRIIASRTIFVLFVVISAAGLAYLTFATNYSAHRNAHAAYARKDYGAAFSQWKLLADTGDADAQFNLGILYSQGQGAARDLVQTMHWWRKAAAAGHLEATYSLGAAYLLGSYVERDDKVGAEWLRKAAERGHAEAQGQLGNPLCQGIGTSQE